MAHRRDERGSLGDLVAEGADAEARKAVAGIALLLISILTVPLGLGLFVVSGVLFYWLFSVVLNVPPGGLPVVVTGAWWIGTAILMFLMFRRLYRWLSRRAPILGRATRYAFGEGADGSRSERVAGSRDGAGPASLGLPAGLPHAALDADEFAPLSEDADPPIDVQMDRLVAGGGELSIRYEKRHSLKLSLVRWQGSALRVVGLIEKSKFLREPTSPSGSSEPPTGPAGRDEPPLRLAALEAAGWQLDAKQAHLFQSWATDSPEDRDHLRREIARTLSILDDGAGGVRPGRYTSEMAGLGDGIANLVLGAMGAAVGAVAGIILLVVVGPGPGSGLAVVLGLTVGFIAGVISGLLGMSQVLHWADGLRSFRGRLEYLWFAAGLVIAGGAALVVVLVIARL